MKEKYINIQEKLLKQGYTITQSAIISYLKRFQLNGKYCFQSKRQIANFFNISESTLKRELSKLEKLGVIIISNEKKYIPVTFYNKKAIVYIDDIIEISSTEEKIESKVCKINKTIDITPSIVKVSTIEDKVVKKQSSKKDIKFTNTLNDLINSLDVNDITEYEFSK